MDLLLTDEEIFQLTFNCSRFPSQQRAGEYAKKIAQAQLDKILNQPWLDKPDSEGWWWPRHLKSLMPAEYITEGMIVNWDYLAQSNVKEWQRALVPEIKEE